MVRYSFDIKEDFCWPQTRRFIKHPGNFPWNLSASYNLCLDLWGEVDRRVYFIWPYNVHSDTRHSFEGRNLNAACIGLKTTR